MANHTHIFSGDLSDTRGKIEANTFNGKIKNFHFTLIRLISLRVPPTAAVNKKDAYFFEFYLVDGESLEWKFQQSRNTK